MSQRHLLIVAASSLLLDILSRTPNQQIGCVIVVNRGLAQPPKEFPPHDFSSILSEMKFPSIRRLTNKNRELVRLRKIDIPRGPRGNQFQSSQQRRGNRLLGNAARKRGRRNGSQR